MTYWQRCAPVENIFWPVITHSSPSRIARVRTAARVGSAVWFGVTQTAVDLPTPRTGTDQCVQLGTPELRDDARDQLVRAEHGEQRSSTPCLFSTHHRFLHAVQGRRLCLRISRSAGEPPLRRQYTSVLGHESVAESSLLLEHLVGEVFVHERQDVVSPEGGQVRVQFDDAEVHAIALSFLRRPGRGGHPAAAGPRRDHRPRVSIHERDGSRAASRTRA